MVKETKLSYVLGICLLLVNLGCETTTSAEQPIASTTDAEEEISALPDAANPDMDDAGLHEDLGCSPCPRGFEPLMGQCGCDDINECEQGLCAGICVNTSGSFECYDDDDNDGVSNTEDNCPDFSNSDQADLDDDTIGDVCDSDDDGDLVSDLEEQRYGTNPRSVDSDDDGIGDFEELQCRRINDEAACPEVAPDTLQLGTPDALNPDVDNDSVLDGDDNCFTIVNPAQTDTDNDGLGDLCDDDLDGDRVASEFDCDDTDPTVGAVVFDQDCDGAPELSRAIRSFSAGWQTTCGILETGALRCFGQVDALGSGPLPPTQKNGDAFTDWVEVSAGSGMACAIHSNGRMDCFGNRAPSPPLDERGQPFADWYTVDVGGDSTPYACAIRMNGQLYCFGSHRAFNPLDGRLAEQRNWVSVSLGVRHGCARSADGDVLCFGENTFNQGTPPEAYQGRWIETDGGYAHTCGRIDTGEMICFGINSDAQLDVPVTTEDEPITDWTSVSVGGFSGCGISETYGILCWGSEYYGQTRVPEAELPWIAMSSGRYHTCGQLSDGTLRCWGWNSRGERDIPQDLAFRQPEPLDNCSGLYNPLQIDSDRDGTGDECDEDRDGDGLSNVDEPIWGLDPDNSDTDGDGTSDGIEFGCTPDCPPEPLNTDPTSPIDALSPDSDGDGVRDENDNCRLSVNLEQTDLDGDGQGDACDLDVDGDGIRADYDCDDTRETLGLRLRDQDCDGVENRPLQSAHLIIGGEFVTCMFDETGAIRCAGQNHFEQTIVPQDSIGWAYRDWRSMDIGFSHGCGLSLSGDLRCWGANYDGRGTPPFDENGFAPLWSHVTTGFAHTCALTTLGVPYCFGANYDGQCDVPLNPETGEHYRFKSIDAGGFHTCGITFDDHLVCFGRSGPLRPTVDNTTRYLSVAAGREHTCAIENTGALRCWSRAGFMPIPRSEDGSPFTDWESVSVGRVHTCGIREGGALTCFGSNPDGQLDLVPPSGRFISVSAGGYHTCAVDEGHRVHCVGRDDHGQVSLLNGLSARMGSGPDNCPETVNPQQEDANENLIGDRCE